MYNVISGEGEGYKPPHPLTKNEEKMWQGLGRRRAKLSVIKKKGNDNYLDFVEKYAQQTLSSTHDGFKYEEEE